MEATRVTDFTDFNIDINSDSEVYWGEIFNIEKAHSVSEMQVGFLL